MDSCLGSRGPPILNSEMKMENISGRSRLLLRSSSVSPTVPSSCSMLFLPGPAFPLSSPRMGCPRGMHQLFRRCQYVHRSSALAFYTMPSSECFHKEKEGETEEDHYAWWEVIS
ncbi:hypothetical protein VPH35_059976 [Triticum aestivum]|uniref:Uncharacterized protein n=1 Tax=Aegilops tauschii subsp. strangulata TaxID=200361 RepID=A0A453F1C8_AEGTS